MMGKGMQDLGPDRTSSLIHCMCRLLPILFIYHELSSSLVYSLITDLQFKCMLLPISVAGLGRYPQPLHGAVCPSQSQPN